MRKWYCLLAVLAMVSFCTVAEGRDIQLTNPMADEGGGFVGEVVSGYGAAAGNGDIVYRQAVESGYYYRPWPGYRDHDDLHLENGGTLVKYSINTFGSTTTGADAGSPYDAHTGLWEDLYGDPDIGIPINEISGTGCDFIQVPTGSSTLTCNIKPGAVTIPADLWSSIEFNTDNSGWKIGGALGDIGWSGDWFAEFDYYYGTYGFYWFGGCPICGTMTMEIVTEGQPWACCDPATFACVNTEETKCAGTHVEGTLCNDMDPPCSEAGACCDTLTGTCTDSFASLCDGYLEQFTAGESCSAVTCDVPDGVPTVTQWGMVVLAVLLLAGLTVKFGRRNAVTA